MVAVVYVQGNLMNAPEAVIIHGCNAQGVMGSGVARQVREKWPDAYRAYMEAYAKRGNKLPLGLPIFAKCHDKIIVNLVTQQTYGRLAGMQYVDYEAVRSGFRKINEMMERLHKLEIVSCAMPFIGCGLGGGKWEIIKRIIEEESKSFVPMVYSQDGTVPA